jgi:hypothetical protein
MNLLIVSKFININIITQTFLHEFPAQSLVNFCVRLHPGIEFSTLPQHSGHL